MKILWFTDIHLRGKSPIHRKDNFYESLKTKVGEVFQLAKENIVDMILFGGDLFHSPVVSLNICDDFIDQAEETDIIIKAIAGNHDMYNTNWSVSSNTTLAHTFRRSNIIEHLDEFNTKDVFIKGVDYAFDVEETLTKEIFINPELDKSKTNILVVHAMIVDKKLPPQVVHILYSDIKSNYNYILVGHNHHEFGIQKIGNCKIVGIGAICRLTIAKNDYERRPKVVIIDTDTKTEKVIELKSAKQKEDVFDFEKIEEIRKFDRTIDKFIESLDSAKVKGLNIKGVIKNIFKESKMDKEVYDCVLDRIGIYEDKIKE